MNHTKIYNIGSDKMLELEETIKTLQELSEKYLVDVPEDIPENANLLLCDEQVKSDANNLSNQEFSDKYLINIDDVPVFKNFLSNNKNVVIYRFDNCEYYADEVVLGYEDQGFHEYESNGDRFFLLQQYAYFDFRVINMTFNNEGTFISVAVNSHPQNFISDPGGWEGEPPISIKPPSEIKDNISSDLIRLLITIAIIVVSVLVICIGFSGVIKGVFSMTFKKKEKDKKNE